MKQVKIFTDGACQGNPGAGGWGAILSYNGTQKEISGAQKETTNNRMELTAVIKALEALKEPCLIDLYTDSKYVCDALVKGWAKKWQSNGWMRNKKERALNIDLWETLLILCDKHSIKFHWIKGHSGHTYNERCDHIATQAIRSLK